MDKQKKKNEKTEEISSLMLWPAMTFPRGGIQRGL
jgi:hypothetical protein